MNNSDPLEQNPWKTLNSGLVYESPWIAVMKHDVLNPAGNEGLYSVVKFKNLAIGVIPVDEEGNTWLVGQWRYPVDGYSWEIPEGGGPLGIAPLESAQRELQEETGLAARNYQEIMRLHLSNSATDELAIVYLATGLSQGEASPEESEVLQIRKVPLEEAIAMAMDGRITDAISVAALLKLHILKTKGQLTLK